MRLGNVVGLVAGSTTAGEQSAADEAERRIALRLESLRVEEEREFSFSLNDA